VQTEQEITARILRELAQILQRADRSCLSDLERHLKQFKKQISPAHVPSGTAFHRIDIFKLHTEGGPEKLREELEKLAQDQLRKLLAEHNFAASAETRTMNPVEMRALILDKVVARLNQGSAFR
jgi:hypothetical protein